MSDGLHALPFACLGVVLGYAVLRTGALFPAAVVHALLNLATIAALEGQVSLAACASVLVALALVSLVLATVVAGVRLGILVPVPVEPVPVDKKPRLPRTVSQCRSPERRSAGASPCTSSISTTSCSTSPTSSATLSFYCDRLGLTGERVDEWRDGKAPFPSARVNATTVIDFVAAPRTGENAEPPLPRRRADRLRRVEGQRSLRRRRRPGHALGRPRPRHLALHPRPRRQHRRAPLLPRLTTNRRQQTALYAVW